MRKCFCLLLAVLLLSSLVACNRVSEDELRVVVLDVGQGDCILVSQGNTHMLVDTGGSAAREDLLGQLHALGVKRLAYFVLTHPHEDHFGNARIILERCQVDALIVSDVSWGDVGYTDVLDCARMQGVKTKKVADGYRFSLGEATCSLVKPDVAGEEENNESLVARVVFGGTSFLLMGDVETAGEQALIAQYGASFLDSDWIKIGHHGSKTATGDALLDIVTPRFAAISCALHNEHGFPDEEVLGRLAERYITVYRTDTSGALYFTSNGEEIVYGK